MTFHLPKWPTDQRRSAAAIAVIHPGWDFWPNPKQSHLIVLFSLKIAEPWAHWWRQTCASTTVTHDLASSWLSPVAWKARRDSKRCSCSQFWSWRGFIPSSIQLQTPLGASRREAFNCPVLLICSDFPICFLRLLCFCHEKVGHAVK